MPFVRSRSRRRLPLKEWTALRLRGRRALRRFGKSADKRSNKFGQRFKYQSFAKKVGGSRAKSSSSLKIATTPGDAGATSMIEYPSTCFIKFYLCSNSLQAGGADIASDPNWTAAGVVNTANADAYQTIGMIDRIYSNSPVDAAHCSWFLLDFFNSERAWQTAPIGNSLMPVHTETTLSNSNCCFSSNTSLSKQGWRAMMITQDRIPKGITDPYKLQAPHTSSTQYRIPDSVITGFDIDISIDSMCMGDQVVTVKLCRLIARDGDEGGNSGVDAGGEWADSMNDNQRVVLLNTPEVTDGRIWETVWSETHNLPAISPWQSSTAKLIKIKKHIDTNYLRTSTRLNRIETTYDVPTFGGVPLYGLNTMPTLHTSTAYHPVDPVMKNNLAFAIVSRCVDEQVPIKTEIGPTAAIVGSASSTVLAGTHREGVSLENMSSEAGGKSFAKFGVSGTITERYRCQEFVYNQHPAVLSTAQLPAPLLPSLEDHDDAPMIGATDVAAYSVLSNTAPVADGVVASNATVILPSLEDHDDTPHNHVGDSSSDVAV